MQGSNDSREILLDRRGANKVQVSSSQERGERSDTPVYWEGQVTSIKAHKEIPTDRAVEENAIQEAPLFLEVCPIRCDIINQDR